jgi:flavin reductase (DIM6/NTAB) family NADH-FMN oxidoreductase RutF
MKNKCIKALGKMTYGIYVLTTSYKDEINGMIASWVSQISYDPPLVVAAIHPNRYSHHLIEQSGSFALHVLANDQAAFLSRFKGADPRGKFGGIQWTKGKTGCPILNDCVAVIECTVIAAYTPGNHTLFVGEIVDAKQFSDQHPLTTLDYEGQYLGRT